MLLSTPVPGAVFFFAMIVYFDESGDLGWNFTRPYTEGGSSRFLTVAFLLVSEDKKHLPKRVIRDLYKRYKWPLTSERKASQLSYNQKKRFCKLTTKLVRKCSGVNFKAITVNKEKVQEHMRQDSNLLYNYMTKLCIIDGLKKYSHVQLIPDERSIRVENKKTLPNYLQTELWFTAGATTKLTYTPGQSHKMLNLLFTDYLAHCIWSAYERKNLEYLEVLQPYVDNRELFFPYDRT